MLYANANETVFPQQCGFGKVSLFVEPQSYAAHTRETNEERSVFLGCYYP